MVGTDATQGVAPVSRLVLHQQERGTIANTHTPHYLIIPYHPDSAYPSPLLTVSHAYVCRSYYDREPSGSASTFIHDNIQGVKCSHGTFPTSDQAQALKMARATKSLLRTVWRCVISLTISLGIITCSVDGNINRSPIGSNSAGSSIVANGSGTDVPQRSAGYISGPSTLQPVMPRRKLREHSYIAACVLVKNEHRYIREWIRYHLAIGVEKFYFFDHLSTPPIATVLEDYVREGYAEVFYFSGSWEQDSSANLQPSLASMRHASPQVLGWNTCAWVDIRLQPPIDTRSADTCAGMDL